MEIKNNKKISRIIITTIIIIIGFFIATFLPLSKKSTTYQNLSSNISNFSDIEDNIPDACAEKISNRFTWIENSTMTFAKKLELDNRIELIYVNCNSKVFNLKDKSKFVNINVPLFALKLKNPSIDHDKITDVKLQFTVGMENIKNYDLDGSKAREFDINTPEKQFSTAFSTPIEQLVSEFSEKPHELTDTAIINKNAEGKISLGQFQVFSNFKVFALENQNLFLKVLEYEHKNETNAIKVNLHQKGAIPFNIFSNENTPKLNDFDLQIHSQYVNRIVFKGRIKLENNKNFKDIQEAFGLTDAEVGEKMKINFDFVAYNPAERKLYNFVARNSTTNGKNFRLSYKFKDFFNGLGDAELTFNKDQRQIDQKINEMPDGILKTWLKSKMSEKTLDTIWQARATIVLELTPEEKYHLATLIPNQIYTWDIFKKDVVKKSTIKLDHKNINDTKINISIYSRFANSNNQNQRLIIEATTKKDKKITIDKTFSGLNTKIEWDLTRNISTMGGNVNFNKVSDIKELSITYGIGDKTVSHNVVNNTSIKAESVVAGKQLPLAPPITPTPPTPPTNSVQKTNLALILGLSIGIPLPLMFLLLVGVTAWAINREVEYRKIKGVDYSKKIRKSKQVKKSKK